MILLIDNFDSFTFNLAQYLRMQGREVLVKRNNALSIAEIHALPLSHIVISPGPCTPNESGISLDVVKVFTDKIPILGVCLGFQAIVQVFGGRIKRADEVMHGKTSPVIHQGTGLFAGIPSPFNAMRYHSLVADVHRIPKEFEVTAWCEDGADQNLVMAIQHKSFPLCGVQFHPESILTEHGHQLIKNFLNTFTSASPISQAI